ncbi:hypothetical protein ACP70R_029151 [Stipagrostis hirtigluma subsp. patula]
MASGIATHPPPTPNPLLRRSEGPGQIAPQRHPRQRFSELQSPRRAGTVRRSATALAESGDSDVSAHAVQRWLSR